MEQLITESHMQVLHVAGLGSMIGAVAFYWLGISLMAWQSVRNTGEVTVGKVPIIFGAWLLISTALMCLQ